MTKRFRYRKIFGKDEWYIEESDYDRATFDSEYNTHLPEYYGINSKNKAEIICDRFNELWDEKERLKKENKQLINNLYSVKKVPLLKICGKTILSKKIEWGDING